MKVFVAESDLGGVVDLHRRRRIDAVALERAELPKRVAAFVHGIETRGDGLVDGLAGVDREAPVEIGSGLRGASVYPLPVGLLERAVDEPAAGGAPEGDRARSLQHFDALRVVEMWKILDVVAEAVDVEVGARIHAADDELVAVAFALVHGDARNVARDVGEVLKARVVDELARDDAERLGAHVAGARRGERNIADRKQRQLRDCPDAMMRSILPAHSPPPKKSSQRRCNNSSL